MDAYDNGVMECHDEGGCVESVRKNCVDKGKKVSEGEHVEMNDIEMIDFDTREVKMGKQGSSSVGAERRESDLPSDEEGCLEEMTPVDDNRPQTTLPLKFFFGAEESKPCEKSKEDEEMEELWNDLALGLAEIANGSDKVEDREAKDEGAANSVVGTDIAARCSRGDHQYYIDDEVGIRCRYCFFVKTHIKNVIPDFGPNIWE